MNATVFAFAQTSPTSIFLDSKQSKKYSAKASPCSPPAMASNPLCFYRPPSFRLRNLKFSDEPPRMALRHLTDRTKSKFIKRSYMNTSKSISLPSHSPRIVKSSANKPPLPNERELETIATPILVPKAPSSSSGGKAGDDEGTDRIERLFSSLNEATLQHEPGMSMTLFVSFSAISVLVLPECLSTICLRYDLLRMPCSSLECVEATIQHLRCFAYHLILLPTWRA